MPAGHGLLHHHDGDTVPEFPSPSVPGEEEMTKSGLLPNTRRCQEVIEHREGYECGLANGSGLTGPHHEAFHTEPINCRRSKPYFYPHTCNLEKTLEFCFLHFPRNDVVLEIYI